MARRRGGRRENRGSRAAQPRRRHRYNLRPTRRRRCRLLGGDQPGRRLCMLNDEEFRKRLKALKVLSAPKVLNVSSVDLRKESNRVHHETDEYEQSDLILRRGNPFTLEITFDRKINKESDIIFLQLTTGVRPQESKGSLLRIPVLAKKKPAKRTKDWKLDSATITDDRAIVTVTPFPRAIIGKYNVFLETKIEGQDKFNRHEVEDEDVYVLFNPWCKDDQVYMSDQSDKEEYVLNDTGRIWVGSARRNMGRPWNFGQFDEPCLDAAMTLLDRAELGDAARASPVAVLRAISAMANSNDEDGVLEGRWTAEYPKDSTAPWAWTGSVAILKQFMETDKPVQYGQCWVFSGIVTTLCRALGIPTRSVTNFQSAHDTDCSMTIDRHWDEEGESVDWMDDSVWNFHVWNESYLKRLDLPAGYDGWQAHDATPQEVSEGVMRCGPASLKAIKEGQVYLSYDTAFIFSEVNGDKINWKVLEDGSMDVLSINSFAVGKNISTKAKNSTFREDVTHLYKYPEGSEKEREVVRFANRFSTRSDEEIYLKSITSDVEFTLSVPDDGSVTEDIEVTMLIQNKSNHTRTVKGRMSVLTSFYTGIPAKRLSGEVTKVEIQAKQQEKVTIRITTQEFQSKLNPEANFQAYANYSVLETGQQWADTENFSLNKPPLIVKVPSKLEKGNKYVGTVSFTNPLEIKITGASFHVEGGRAIGSQIFEHKKPIAPKETVTIEFDIAPRRRGRREVDASLSSNQLSGVDGSVEFRVV